MSAFIRRHRLPPGWKPDGWHTFHGVVAIAVSILAAIALVVLSLVLP